MNKELKKLVRANYRKRIISSQSNFVGFEMNGIEGKLKLRFHKKPPSLIRQTLRINGFSWSRKYRYWRSYLNENQIDKVKRFYQFINKD